MKSVGRIGVIIPAVADSLESALLKEIYNQASRYGYDVIVFTNSSNSLDSFAENEYVYGEEKIYELIKSVELDGILFAAGRFHSNRVINYIMELLKECSTPSVILEMKQDDFPYVYASQRGDLFAVTEHLITVHEYEKIYCLTGPENSYEAEERLSGFRMAMEHYGLDSSNYFYGDFWKSSAVLLADKIISGKLEMPEAVVCTNDTMALSLCDELKKHGIRVPEQIAVTGYDGCFEALSYDPVLTTVVHKEKELAVRAFSKLCEILRPDLSVEMNDRKNNVRYGESCGCLPKRTNTQQKIHYNIIQNKSLQELYLNSNLMVNMSEAKSLREFTEIISRLTYLITDMKNLDICLCSGWQGDDIYLKEPENNSSYTQKMMLIFSDKYGFNSNDNCLFDIKTILPSLSKEHEPQFIVLLPIHYVSWNLGYMGMYYENGGHYHMDTFLQYWRDSLSNGLNILSSRINMEYMNKVIEEYSVRDQLTGMLNKKGLLRECEDYFSTAKKEGKRCFVMSVSWSEYAGSTRNKNNTIDTVFSNALTMICSDDKLCARTGERFFAILMQSDCNEKMSETVYKFIISLEQMLSKLQGQPGFPDIPDIDCDFWEVSSLKETKEFLNTVKDRTIKKYDEKNSVTDYSVLLKRIRKEIYISPQNEWTSKSFADKLGISDSYFRKIYKHQFSVSFKEDHINSRINKAKALLAETNLNVVEIAAKCGFNNASHFMRIFKIKEGKTAVQFRKGE